MSLRWFGGKLGAPLVAIAVGLTACTGDPPSPGRLDLVFVVENAGSMREKQAEFAAQLPLLLAGLRNGEGELPDLHLAVVSSDVGAGPAEIGRCLPGGDQGRFQLRAECGIDPATTTERFLSLNPANRNFIGEPSTVLGCLAQLGNFGCAFEHHLQSLRLALTAAPGNRGFLRGGADLGIVFLAEEDDCSAVADANFFGQPDGNSGSFRCAERGHSCGGTPIPAVDGFSAPLASCTATERSASEPAADRLINVSEFVAAIKALKPGAENRIAVAAIVGWNDYANGYTVTAEGYGQATRPLAVQPACQSGAIGQAFPGVRLHTFATAFPRHGVHSACADYAATMTAIGQLLRPTPP